MNIEILRFCDTTSITPNFEIALCVTHLAKYSSLKQQRRMDLAHVDKREEHHQKEEIL